MDLPAGYDRASTPDIPKQAVPRCPACESGDRRERAIVREHEYDTTTDDPFPLMECAACGAWYLDPRPDVSALDVIYPPNYFAYVLEAQADSRSTEQSGGVYAALRSWLYQRRIAPIEAQVPLSPKTRWLDIGCGDGAVLEALRASHGVVGKGLDLSERSVRICRRLGFEAEAGRFEDYEAGEGERYDVVHSSHVIEHLESPLEYMRKVYELLEPGGVSVFITPSHDTWEAKRFGKHWGGLHVPRHWCVLDTHSAKLLGERAGFEHVLTSFSTNSGFWTFSAHALTQAAFGRRVADALFASDHRVTKSSLWNLARSAAFTGIDVLTLLATRRSANMLVMHRKPLGA